MADAMKRVVTKMRADFVLVAEARKERGDWTEGDEAEIGEAIRAAIAADDPDMILSWANWLADLAASITAWSLIVRGSMARMRHQAREQREARDKATGARR